MTDINKGGRRGYNCLQKITTLTVRHKQQELTSQNHVNMRWRPKTKMVYLSSKPDVVAKYVNFQNPSSEETVN
jgi:hypothetical protein